MAQYSIIDNLLLPRVSKTKTNVIRDTISDALPLRFALGRMGKSEFPGRNPSRSFIWLSGGSVFNRGVGTLICANGLLCNCQVVIVNEMRMIVF